MIRAIMLAAMLAMFVTAAAIMPPLPKVGPAAPEPDWWTMSGQNKDYAPMRGVDWWTRSGEAEVPG